MKGLQTIILMLTFLNLLGCEGFGQTAKIGEQFTLAMNKSAKIKGANLEITVNRVGRKWLANGGEILDFSFSVKHDGKTDEYSYMPLSPVTAGDYKIEIVKTEPFGEGYATFIVTKKDSVKKNDPNDQAAAKFVEQFGWHIDESISPVKIALDIPQNFDNLPFYHYQSASERSGVDMTPLLGKNFEMLRYTLREKQSEKGKDFDIFANLIIENGRVTGAWRTDSSDSTPGIYSFVKR